MYVYLFFISFVVQLHRGCGLLHPKDVEDTVYTMRALAKFLGFLDFLPYRKSAPDSMLHAREMMVWWIVVCEAYNIIIEILK